MKNKTYFFLLFIVFGTFLSNCNCKRLCTNPAPQLCFINFDSSQLNVIIVKSTNQTGQPNQLQETKVYTNKSMPGPDTLQTYKNRIFLDNAITTNYIIEVPAVGKSWSIRNITMHPDKMDVTACTSGISYYLNDTLITMHTIPYATDSTGFINLVR